MAKERTYNCEDCGHEEASYSQQAKRCHACRLLNNLSFMKARTSKCWLCDEVFCPIARDDQLCANCVVHKKDAEQVECKYCGETKTSVAKSIRVCAWCARDRQRRKQFMQDVLALVRWRTQHQEVAA